MDRRLEAVEEWTSKVDAALRLTGPRGAGVTKVGRCRLTLSNSSCNRLELSA